MAERLEYTVLSLIEDAVRNMKAQPLNLGGVAGAGGGIGGPPGGFIGWLPQYRVAYDETEAAYSGILTSGGSLVDNLAHIRYRLGVVESGILIVDDWDGSPTIQHVTELTFSGATVTQLSPGHALVVVSGGGTGTALTVKEADGTPTVANVDTIIFSGAVVTDLGDGDVLVTVSGGSFDVTQGDARYLKLDASNDPITGRLDINHYINLKPPKYQRAIAATVSGSYLATMYQVESDSYEENSPFAYIGRYGNSTPVIFNDYYWSVEDYAPAIFSGGFLLYQHFDEAYNITVLTDLNPYVGSGGAAVMFDTFNHISESGRLLSLKNQTVEKFYVTGSGRPYDNHGYLRNGMARRYFEEDVTVPSGYSMILVDYLNTNGYNLTLQGDAAVAIINGDPQDNSGWIAITDTLSYSSADSPTFVVSTATDLTGIVGVGDKIKLTQTTAKYFIITAITSNSITLYGGTDYTLVNATITSPYYSHAKSPLGFPTSPAKWSVVFSDSSERAQSSPVGATWYNLGSLSTSFPIGLWKVRYTVYTYMNKTSNLSSALEFTLSTSNNSESDSTMKSSLYTGVLTSTMELGQLYTFSRPTVLSLAAKTTYYVIARTAATASYLSILNNLAPLTVVLECAYL